MFGSILEDRRARLLVGALALAACYLAGGAAVANGLSDAIGARADAHSAVPRLAYLGDDPFSASELPDAPDAALILHVSRAHDTREREWVIAAIIRGAISVPEGARGLGAAVPVGILEFPENITVAGRMTSTDIPRGWVYLAPDEFERVASAARSRVLLVPANVIAPLDANVLPLQGGREFLSLGGNGVVRAFAGLVAATSFVATIFTSTIVASAIEARRADVALFLDLGGSRVALAREILRWLARVVALGLVLGAASGIVIAYGVFSIGNRVGVHAPVVPAPDVLYFVTAMMTLAVTSILVGLAVGMRVAKRISRERAGVSA